MTPADSRLSTVLRVIGFCAVLGGLIYIPASSEELDRLWAGAGGRWFEALAVMLVGVVLVVVRFWFFLRSFQLAHETGTIEAARLSVLTVLGIDLRAFFFFFILPSGVGVDIARFRELRGRVTAPVSSLLSLLLVDRLCGVVVFAAIALVLLPAGVLVDLPAPVSGQEDARGPLVFGVVAGGVLLVSAAVWLYRRLDRETLRARVRELLETLRMFAARLPFALLITVASHGCMFVSVWILADAMAIDVSLLTIVAVMSAGLLLQVLPVSVFGFGATELSTAALYVLVGLRPAEAVLLSFALYALRLNVALLGGLVQAATWLADRRRAT